MIKKLALILLILSISHNISAQDYRVKKVSLNSEYVTIFNYSDDQLTSYTESKNGSSTTYSIKYDKNKIVITSDRSKDKDEIKFNKKGEIEKIRNIEFKYNKEDRKRSYKQKDIFGQWQSTYNLLYDEEGVLKTIAYENAYIGDASLLFYNKDGRCERVLEGAYANKENADGKIEQYNNDIRATWDGDKIISIVWKDNTGLKVIKKHEFEYNENNLVIKEIVSTLDEETDKMDVEDEVIIEYEPGIGNEKLVYTSFRNVPLNIAFDIVTFSFYKYIFK